MNTAEVLIKSLESEGVKYIFGIPGEETLELMEAIKKSSIKFITVRHEQGAAFMADVYGRLTGKAGVCLSTLGPGATNLVTGVAEFTPITKRSKQVVRPDTVNEIVRIAFKYAEMEKPGACHIDLPCNIAAMEVEGDVAQTPLKHHRENTVYASTDAILAAGGVFANAKRPVVLVGHSAVRNHASEALRAFVSSSKIPVVCTMMAKGVIPTCEKYFMGCIGLPQRDYPNIVMEQADLVIAVGYEPEWRQDDYSHRRNAEPCEQILSARRRNHWRHLRITRCALQRLSKLLGTGMGDANPCDDGGRAFALRSRYELPADTAEGATRHPPRFGR